MHVVHHGAERDRQRDRDLLIGVPGGDDGGHLLFARCQAGETRVPPRSDDGDDSVIACVDPDVLASVVHRGQLPEREVGRGCADSLDQAVDGVGGVLGHRQQRS